MISGHLGIVAFVIYVAAWIAAMLYFYFRYLRTWSNLKPYTPNGEKLIEYPRKISITNLVIFALFAVLIVFVCLNLWR